MRLDNKNTVIDFAKYAFNSNKKNGSYVYTSTCYCDDWHDDEIIPFDNEEELVPVKIKYSKYVEKVMFHCEKCNNAYDTDKLTIMNQTIHCKCGHSVKIEDLRPYTIADNYYSSGETLSLIHNVKNGTYNKLNVPTILTRSEYMFYCPECHKIDDIYTYEKKDGELICECGKHYTFEECKIDFIGGGLIPISGGIYFDGHKISMSIIKHESNISRYDKYFWSTGTTRCTMNLETGYTYLTNTGCCYTEANRAWKRYNTGKAPKMFNATYCELYWNHLDDLVRIYVRNLYIKYANHPNLVNLIAKHRRKLERAMEDKLVKQIDEYMTAYYNNKYSYRIKSLEEIFIEAGAHFKDRHNILSMIIYHNRFINANYTDLNRNLSVMFNNIKSASIRKVFRKMGRETNKPLLDLVGALAPISKSLRKKVAADYTNSETLDWNDGLFLFIIMSEYFTKKENLNKLYEILKFKNAASIYNAQTSIPFWLKYRSEEYISNLSRSEFNTKYFHIRDAMYMINTIKDVYGDDWNESSIEFHNEKQFHDALMDITRSQAFKDVKDAQRRLRMQEPFKMEEEVFNLENNDITIALNEYELSTIGNEMHICVGGYGNDVRNHNCRIAYIKDNDEFVACLELRMAKKDKKVTYELRQAKLKYNNLVGTNEKYYNIVYDWCNKNDIKINTYDMEMSF